MFHASLNLTSHYPPNTIYRPYFQSHNLKYFS
nr:MAG TPA: 39S ribosomal protein L2 [Caudoviricetes sp.]